MNARNNSLRSINLDEFERELREIASASVARKASDPLAELARIVGREVLPRGKPVIPAQDSEPAPGGSEPRGAQDCETSGQADSGDAPGEAQAEIISIRAEPDPAAVQAPKPQARHADADEAIGDAWASPRGESYAPQYPQYSQYEDDIGPIDVGEDPAAGRRARLSNDPTWRMLAQRHPFAVLSAVALIAVGLGAAMLARFSQDARIDASAPAAIVDENPVKNTPTTIIADDAPPPTPAASAPLAAKAAETPMAPAGQGADTTAALGQPTADAGVQPSPAPTADVKQPVPNPAGLFSPAPATAALGGTVQPAPGLVAGSVRPPPTVATISPPLAGPLSTQTPSPESIGRTPAQAKPVPGAEPSAPPAPGQKPPEVVGSTSPTPTPAVKGVAPSGKGKVSDKGQTPATSSPPRAAAVKDAGAGSYSVKLASSTTEKDAQMTMMHLQKEFPGVLAHAYVKREDMGAEGVFYRVRVGPLSRDAADKLCSQLRAAGKSCASTIGHNGA